MTDALPIATQVLAALSRSGIPHMVVGSFARNFHAFARSTQDADIVLAVDAAGLSRFEAELGADFSLDPQATFETITGTFRHTLRHTATEFKTELFLLSNDPSDQERFRRRQPFLFNGHPSYVLTAEDGFCLLPCLIVAQVESRSFGEPQAQSVAGTSWRCVRLYAMDHYNFFFYIIIY